MKKVQALGVIIWFMVIVFMLTAVFVMEKNLTELTEQLEISVEQNQRLLTMNKQLFSIIDDMVEYEKSSGIITGLDYDKFEWFKQNREWLMEALGIDYLWGD